MQIIEKLSVSAPSPEARLNVLKEIAQEYNVVWDSSQSEAALSKKHEDLLGGSKEIYGGASTPQASVKQSSPRSSSSNGARPILPSETKSSNAVPVIDTKRETTSQSSDVLERARAAIASAERASAAARAAAQLVNAEFGSLKLEGKSS
ncbi:hypothetical protein Patl1_14970 [Pistacia atlantica]|uniref:Uncharacterized protein n=1 Tax=Pistacia atlantica TaxID=434234 RepID=A0ACC1BAU1_9ROSI|nr:hypothetical protein Patl1_14970 [Pistacia atlantica]